MGRPPCCDKANVKRGLWTAEEDAKILAYVSTHGTGNWTQVPKKAGLNRCGKSCRLRWTNYLRPDLKHDEFTDQEEELIIQYHAAIGSRWSLIAKQLPGRTDNDVKNYWNTKLKKKLGKLGIDPITHKPFTKIFSDYQNISCLTTNHHSTFQELSSQCRTPPFTQSGIHTDNTNVMHFMHQFQDVYSYNNNYLIQQESYHHYMDELSPTSSSSSSSSISNRHAISSAFVMSSGAYNWGEQSFGQPLLTNDVKEEENIQQFLVTDLQTQNQEKFVQCELSALNLNDAVEGENVLSDSKVANETTEISNNCGPSSVSSFVKALLDLDSEMQLSFPVFEDILDY